MNIRKDKKRARRMAGFVTYDRLFLWLHRGVAGVKPLRKFKAPTKRGVRPTILTFQHRLAEIYQVPLYRMLGRTSAEEAVRLRETGR